jgi:hypothetical protein
MPAQIDVKYLHKVPPAPTRHLHNFLIKFGILQLTYEGQLTLGWSTTYP